MNISFLSDFALILLAVTIFTGVVVLVDVIYTKLTKDPNYVNIEKKQKPILIDYSRAFFPVLLIVLLIRSFIAQPYRVPSGSLEPTVKPGDLIFVTQFNYGLRFPVWNKKLIAVSEPKRGQIVLFHWPVNRKVTFVKRTIGLPGDHISYINKVLYINGKEQKQKFIKTVTQFNDFNDMTTYREYQENLNGIKHLIFVRPDMPATNFYNLVVPKGDYFMMGDNRDESDDSRGWGFVPEHSLIGRAMMIFMSWDSRANWVHKIRWNRIGTLFTSLHTPNPT